MTEVGLGGPILGSSFWMFVRHVFWFSTSMHACAIKACMSWVWISERTSIEGKSMRMKRKLSRAIFWVVTEREHQKDGQIFLLMVFRSTFYLFIYLYTLQSRRRQEVSLSKVRAFLLSFSIHIPFMLFLWTKVPSYSNAFFCWRHGMIFPALSLLLSSRLNNAISPVKRNHKPNC